MEKNKLDTAAHLRGAARAEFEMHGYGGTNTNAIARRAGFAPQTFYRHFDDKLAIFLAVYRDWAEEELILLAGARTAEEIADILLKHHQRSRVFRRSLRSLTVSNPVVAAQRAASRRQQLRQLRNGTDIDVDHIAALLTVERLCDAAADGEFTALGVADSEVRLAICDAIQKAIMVFQQT